MANQSTARYGLPYPDYTESPDVVRDLSELAEAVEKLLVDTYIPVGLILAYVGSSAPTGWQLCDGTPCKTDDLKAALGAANVPDLRGSFVQGVAPAGVGVTGGSDLVSLTAANQPNHTHPVSGSDAQTLPHQHTASHAGITFNDVGHSHVLANGMHFALGTTGPGRHQIGGGNMGVTNTWNVAMSDGWVPTLNNDGSPAWAHAHTANAFAAASGGAAEADHGHTFAIAPAGGGAAFSNVPPYYAVMFIIRT